MFKNELILSSSSTWTEYFAEINSLKISSFVDDKALFLNAVFNYFDKYKFDSNDFCI